MYGLILEGIGDAMRRKFGDDAWEETRQKAGITHHSFNMHRTYSETVIPRLAKAASDITGRPIDDLMELCGYSFVAFIAPYGYDRVLRVLGRHLRDLLSGLDNLHEYLKFRSDENNFKSTVVMIPTWLLLEVPRNDASDDKVGMMVW